MSKSLPGETGAQLAMNYDSISLAFGVSWHDVEFGWGITRTSEKSLNTPRKKKTFDCGDIAGRYIRVPLSVLWPQKLKGIP